MGFLSENNIRFLNREGETRYITRFIASPASGLLGIHGPGGIGKTVLSWWTADESSRQGLPHAYINLAHFPFTDSVDILRVIAEQLDPSHQFVDFWESLSGYHTHFQSRFLSAQNKHTRVAANLVQDRKGIIAAFIQSARQLAGGQSLVLIFDNLDAIGRPDRLSLEEEVFVPLTEIPKVKIFGISRAQLQWRDPVMDQRYNVLHLPPFEEDDARDLTRLVWPELLERDAYLRALKVSRGHPYSVMRLAKVGARYFHLSEENLYEVLLEELWENVITRFMLKGLSDTLQDLLFEISIVRFFDMSGFKYFSRRTNLLPETPPSKMLALLDTMNYDVSAVQFDKVKKGYQLQPPIRPVSLELHRLSEALEALNQAALEFYRAYLEHLPPGFDEWRRCVIEMTYHQGVIGNQPDTAKNFLAHALAQLRNTQALDSAFKLRDELGGDWDLPSAIWQDVFTYFEDLALRHNAA